MADPDRTQKILNELHAWGLTLAIDDFGTGYSSLARLKHMPVDILKIDQAFVRDVDKDLGLAGMVRAMIQLAQSLDMTPLAEGIETHRSRVPALERVPPGPGIPLLTTGPGRADPGARAPRGRARARPDVQPRLSGAPADASAGSLPSAAMSRRYDASEIEPKWQRVWEEEGLYRASEDPQDPRPRFYALDMFPYPSGDLHMGHAEAFSGGDTVARYKAMQGYNVLHPIGWDAFGLPAENAAIKRGVAPKEWTYANIEQQAASFKRMGMSFDWTRRLAHVATPRTTDGPSGSSCGSSSAGWPTARTSPVNWCPNDQTVLANEQVIAGACERCGTMVERRDLTQWFFRITDYAQRLLDDDGRAGRLARARHHDAAQLDRAQRGRPRWSSRSRRPARRSPVFTTRPDTLWGVTFFVFAVEHPAVRRLAELGGTLGEVEPLIEHGARELAGQPRGGRHEGRRARSACTPSTP